jgi:hypothetical protein
MKTKLAALILAATFGLAASSFADEPHTQTMKIKALDGTIVELIQESQTHSVKIRAHGETIAEFKVSTNNPVVVEGGLMVDINSKPRRLIGAKGGAITVRINCAGEFPMIFKADEVELFSDRKPGGMLLAE